MVGDIHLERGDKKAGIQGGFDPGSAHLFYGVVILFTVAFAYVYRAQFERRPALAWALLMLFMCGLGIRGWLNFLVWF